MIGFWCALYDILGNRGNWASEIEKFEEKKYRSNQEKKIRKIFYNLSKSEIFKFFIFNPATWDSQIRKIFYGPSKTCL